MAAAAMRRHDSDDRALAVIVDANCLRPRIGIATALSTARSTSPR